MSMSGALEKLVEYTLSLPELVDATNDPPKMAGNNLSERIHSSASSGHVWIKEAILEDHRSLYDRMEIRWRLEKVDGNR